MSSAPKQEPTWQSLVRTSPQITAMEQLGDMRNVAVVAGEIWLEGY